MPHFLVHSAYAEGSAELRASLREAHKSHVRTTGPTRLAGPTMAGDGSFDGSVLVIEAEDEAAARAFCEADPFYTGGAYASVNIVPLKLTFVDIDRMAL